MMEARNKFRAWDKQSNCWFYIQVGCNVQSVWETYNRLCAEDAEWFQCTGLTDKYGMEIYEGDIITAKYYGLYMERISWDGPPDIIGEVYWDLISFHIKAKGEKDFRYSGFEAFTDNTHFSGLINMKESQTEIIGNIIQNPELLPIEPLNT